MTHERIFAEWTKNPDGEHLNDRRVLFSVEGTDPEETYFKADFDHKHETTSRVVYGLPLRVETEHRGRGYARHMLGALAFLAHRENF